MAAASVNAVQLEGKRVLVTGAGRGIGRAIALICHEEGAKVAISSRTREELEETVALALSKQQEEQHQQQASSSTCHDTDRRMDLYVADVTKKNDVDDMVQKITDTWGGIDIAINNAGGSQGPKGNVDELQDDQVLSNLLSLNVVGPHIVTSSVVRLAMTTNKNDNDDDDDSPVRGQILNISSKAGKVGLPSMSFYVASKFALEGMTSTWSKELKDRQITVNSMSPGMVDTKSFPKAPGKPGVRSAESIRDCLLFALSTTCQSMEYTGHYVHVDEFDRVKELGLPDVRAWKPIDEQPFNLS
eukprot:CAMPEP_0113524576 /NCGR_PEP_ID=MMETSP0014_2-20120614/46289_1 /TAXON_ID=2857 /ORGANISM="Nitzschia sp." /LENGTH=300 /DNA_ID=CAMNT_0000422695 /DNA_START=266 /DNA_END=1168 /DNA_ORIENTATION=+ /assembly_acc=CAM_ASM_000159